MYNLCLCPRCCCYCVGFYVAQLSMYWHLFIYVGRQKRTADQTLNLYCGLMLSSSTITSTPPLSMHLLFYV